MSVLRGRQDRAGQRGFTLIEFLVAFAISALLLVGSVVIMRYIVVATAENGDRTLAQLQVHYVSSWLVDDVVQAERINFGNSTGTGFPIIINDGTVTYDVVDNMGENPWQLTRTVEIGGDNQTLVVAEYLVPWGGSWLTGTSYNVNDCVNDNGSSYVCIAAHTSSSSNEPGAGASWTTYWKVQQGTRCYQKIVDGTPVDVLVLEVTAKVDQREESGSYEISPRSSNVVWEFRE